MMASDNTVRSVLLALETHCTEEQIDRLMEDLQRIPGNSSFRATVGRLIEMHESKKWGRTKYGKKEA